MKKRIGWLLYIVLLILLRCTLMAQAASVTLMWDLKPAGDGCTGYNIYRSANADGSAATKLTTTAVAATVNTYTDATPTVGKTWYYYATAVYPAANGGETGKSNIVTALVPMPPVTNMRVTVVVSVGP